MQRKLTENYNRHHPELADASSDEEEVFMGNLDDAAYDALPFTTKRRGNKAYSASGQLVFGERPTFVSRTELENHPDNETYIMQLLLAGVW